LKTFARYTALIFMILGIIIVLFGIYIAISGIISQKPGIPTTLTLMSDFSGLFKMINIIIGGAVGLQGLFLAAIGQGLWLLATIASEAEMTSDYLYDIVRRGNQVNQ
jgi:hypothetical protein